MNNKEKLEIAGLEKKPGYWDERYMNGIEKMTPRIYDIMFFKKPEMLKNKHFRLFLFLVCF